MRPLTTVERAWPVLGALMRGHARIYRATGGRIGRKVPGLPPLLLLDHVGAKSGKLRTVPLAYLSDGEDLVVVASRGGYDKNPGWVHNLRANPDTEIQIGRRRVAVHASEAAEDERARLWPLLLEHNPVYDRYTELTDREFPIVILRPGGSAP
jgi:deazaflavin-dependent oxidoreductase (nitroreductase family)